MPEKPKNYALKEWRDAAAATRYLKGQGYVEDDPNDPSKGRITDKGRAVLEVLCFWSPQTAISAAMQRVIMKLERGNPI